MIETVYGTNNAVIKILTDELEMYKIPTLKTAIGEILGRQPAMVILDMAAVESVDSSAIGAFFYFNKIIKSYGGKMILVELTEQVDSILRATQSMGLLTVYNSAEEAIAAGQKISA